MDHAAFDSITRNFASQEDLTAMGSSSSADALLQYPMIKHSTFGSLYDLLPEELGRLMTSGGLH